MTMLSKNQRETLRSFVVEYNNKCLSEIQSTLLRMRLPTPQEFNDCLQDSQVLIGLLGKNSAGEIDIDEKLIAHIKRSVIHTRRDRALANEVRGGQTFNKELREAIDQELKPISAVTESRWFRETVAMKPVRLGDMVSIQVAEQRLTDEGSLTQLPREYDEKFGILLAPALFQPDLSYYRLTCELRSSSVCVAYIDIDNFKEFNTTYGNPMVDRDILPRFMTALEAHLYFHGNAYRHGGDEYVALMPNTSCAKAALLFQEFQRVLRSVEYIGVEQGPTVSIGICEITEDCALTGHEIEVKAANAMVAAKEKGKNCIATMVDPNYDDTPIDYLRDQGE